MNRSDANWYLESLTSTASPPITFRQARAVLQNIKHNSSSDFMASCLVTKNHKHADRNPSLHVTAGEYGEALVFCFVCGKARQDEVFGAIQDRVREIGATDDSVPVAPYQKKVFEGKEADVQAMVSALADNPECLAYIASRGISVEIAKQLRWGYRPSRLRRNSELEPALTIPHYVGRNLVGVKARNIRGVKAFSQLPGSSIDGLYAVSHLSHLDSLADSDTDSVLVLEGPEDCALAMSYGWNATAIIASGSKLVPGDIEVLSKYTRIFLMGDMDEAGQNAMDRLQKSLPKQKVIRVQLDGFNDVGDLYAFDPENFAGGLRQVLKLAEASVKAPISNVIQLPNPNGEAELEEPEVVEEPLPAFPRVSGTLSDLADAICPDIPYEFKAMAALTHVGLIRSGLDCLEDDKHLQPRFYTCLVKEPGWGKSAALNEVKKCLNSISTGCSIVASVDSGPALVDEFSERNILAPEDIAARLLIETDEMADLFEKAKVSPQSRNSLATELLKLYEHNTTGNHSRKAGKSQIENAHLAIIGGATPQGYGRMWTGTGGGSAGLQSRLVVITTSGPKMPVHKTPTDSVALNAALARLAKQLAQPAQLIRMDDEARQMLADWWDSSLREKPSETRVVDMVKRLLIVLALTNDTTTIGRDLMAQAIQFGDYLIACREKFNPDDSYSWVQAFENDIMRVAKRHTEPLTLRDYRRLIHPERKPGGLGPFLQAWRNVIAVGDLKADGTTRSGTPKFRWGRQGDPS